jgi:hypothetical protein
VQAVERSKASRICAEDDSTRDVEGICFDDHARSAVLVQVGYMLGMMGQTIEQ